MSALTNYLANGVLGHAMGKTAIFSLPTVFLALFQATAGQSPRNTAVTLGQTTIPATPNGHMYRCTTAGTTQTAGTGEPSWSTAQGGTTTDGTAVWTEMFSDFFNNTTANLKEATYTGYGRAPTSGVWSTPNSGSINNASPIPFGQDTALSQVICAAATFDASTGGNMLMYEIASATSAVLAVSPNVIPSFGTSALSFSLT